MPYDDKIEGFRWFCISCLEDLNPSTEHIEGTKVTNKKGRVRKVRVLGLVAHSYGT